MLNKKIHFTFLFVLILKLSVAQQNSVTSWGYLNGFVDQPVLKIASGRTHFIAMKKDSSLVAWGRNGSGEATIPKDLKHPRQIAAGNEFSVVLEADSTVKVWGSNFFGVCNTPAQLKKVIAVDAGYTFVVALKSDSTVTAWGGNINGEINVPVGLKNVTAISANGYNTMALLSDSTVVTWGYSSEDAKVPKDLKSVIAISAGPEHNVALKADGNVVIWGQYNFTIDTYYSGHDVSRIKKIIASNGFTLIIREDGSIKRFVSVPYSSRIFYSGAVQDACSDYNFTLFLEENGNLGISFGENNYEGYQNEDIPLPIENVKKIAAGQNFSVALTQKDEVVAWGTKFNYLNSDKDSEEKFVQNTLFTLRDSVVELAAGKNHVITLNKKGDVRVLGLKNIYDPNNPFNFISPPSIVRKIKKIAAGQHTCIFLNEEGKVLTWPNSYSTPDIYYYFYSPPGTSKIKEISAGVNFYVALNEDGSVVTWPIENLDSIALKNIKVPVNLNHVRAISARNGHILALKYDGTVVAWGQNDKGQADVPLNLNSVIAISAGDYFSTALKEDGSVVAWGDTTYHQLSFPNSLENVLSISAGSNHAIAIVGDKIKGPRFSGVVYRDNIKNDCKKDSTEKGLSNVILKATPGDFYTSSDSSGFFTIPVNIGINTTISRVQNPIQKLFSLDTCKLAKSGIVLSSNMDTCCIDFGVKDIPCSIFNVDIQNTRRRRCFRGTTTVRYCLEGNVSSKTAQLKVLYPEYVVPVSSSPVWSKRNGQELIYDLVDVQANSCANIIIADSVICGNETIRGLTQCTHATINKLSTCFSDSDWDGSDVSISKECRNGKAQFIMANHGSNMIDSANYRVFINDTLIARNKYLLQAQKQIQLEVTANGKTIRLETDQSKGYPGFSKPVGVIESCINKNQLSATVLRNFVATRAMDDKDFNEAETCQQIIDSYDPNDLQAQPTGVGNFHYIKSGEAIKYTIRFQNTGSDTAFKVVVTDTLDPLLDITTFTEGASSHPYTFSLIPGMKNVFKFSFNKIMLPHSRVDTAGSNGFVSFYISTLPDAIDGSVVKNESQIYFDFNSAIITNEVFHTIGDYQIEDFSKGEVLAESSPQPLQVDKEYRSENNSSVYVYPLPANDWVTIVGNQIKKGDMLELQEIVGNKIAKFSLTSSGDHLNVQSFPRGIYLYTIMRGEEKIAVGKLILE